MRIITADERKRGRKQRELASDGGPGTPRPERVQEGIRRQGGLSAVMSGCVSCCGKLSVSKGRLLCARLLAKDYAPEQKGRIVSCPLPAWYADISNGKREPPSMEEVEAARPRLAPTE